MEDALLHSLPESSPHPMPFLCLCRRKGVGNLVLESCSLWVDDTKLTGNIISRMFLFYNICYTVLYIKQLLFYSVSLRLVRAHAWMLRGRRFEGVMMVQARSRYDSHAAVLKFAIPSLTKCWRAPRTCAHSWQPSSPESVLKSMRKSTLFRCLVSDGRIGLEKLVPNFSLQS